MKLTRVLHLALFGLFIAAAAVPATATAGEPSRALRRRIARLARDLGSKRQSTRQSSAKELVKIGKPAVPALKKAVEGANGLARAAAVVALAQIGPAAKEALPAIIKALTDSRDKVKTAACWAVYTIGPTPEAIPGLAGNVLGVDKNATRYSVYCLVKLAPQHPEAATPLGRALGQSDKKIRALAEMTLRKLGLKAVPAYATACAFSYRRERTVELAEKYLRPLGRGAVPELAKCLEKKNYLLNLGGVKALGALGWRARSTTSELARFMADQKHDHKTRVEAVLALGRVGRGHPQALKALEAALWSKNIDVQKAAARALGEMKAAASPAVSELLKLLRSDRFYSTRTEAAAALGAIGPAAREAVPALIALLENKKTHGNVRAAVARALGGIGPAAKAAVPVLLKEFAPGGSKFMRKAAADGLGGIGPDAKAAVPALAAATASKDYTVRRHTARALGRIGPAAKQAVPQLADSYVGYYAGSTESGLAMGRIGSANKKALEKLHYYLVNKHNGHRSLAALILVMLGQSRKQALATLRRDLTDRKEYKSVYKRRAVAGVMKHSPEVTALLVPELLVALDDKDAEVRKEARAAFAAAGGRPVPALVKALEHKDVSFRHRAVELLGRIGAPAIPALTAALKSEAARTRLYAARALGLMGPEAASAAGALEGLLRDRVGYVRVEAGRALAAARGTQPASTPAAAIAPAAALGTYRQALNAARAHFRVKKPNEGLAELDKAIGGLQKEAQAGTSGAAELCYDACLMRAVALRALKKPNEAMKDLAAAVKLLPDRTEAYAHRAALWDAHRRWGASAKEYTQLLRLTKKGPDRSRLLLGRAERLAAARSYKAAVIDYDQLVKLAPRNPGLYYGRALARSGGGDHKGAIADLTAAIGLQPRDMRFFAARGKAYQALGRHAEAIADFSARVKLAAGKPDDLLGPSPLLWRTYVDRGDAYAARGDHAMALADYRKALAVSPRSADVHNRLSWTLATAPEAKVRNGKQAVKHGETAVKLTARKNLFMLDTLAAAYAEAGRFADAVRAQKEALGLWAKGHGEKLRKEMHSRVKLYQAGKPFHEQPRE
jgi:HEAT repeat protein